MGVRIVETRAAQELLRAEIELVRAKAGDCGAVTLLAGGVGEKRRLQRELARAGVGLGVAVTVPAFWLADRWGLYGDGRSAVGASDRRLIMADVLARATEAERGPLGSNAGTAKLLARMAAELLPQAAASAARAADGAEACAAGLLARYRAELERRGLVELCEAAQLLSAEPAAFGGCVILRGVDALPAYLVDALRAQAREGEVVILLDAQGVAMADELARAFAPEPVGRDRIAGAPEPPCPLAAELDEIFSHRLAAGRDGEPCRPADAARTAEPLEVCKLSLAEIAGPTAQAHAEARIVEGAALAARADADGSARTGGGAPHVLVVSPRPDEAFYRLAPWLAARGMAAQARVGRTFAETYVGEQFFSLIDLARSLANDPAGAWWPAPALSDWLLSPLSGCPRAEARRADKKLRGSRDLTAEKVMSMLQGLQARERKARRARAAERGEAPQGAPDRAALGPSDPVPPTDGVACCDVVEALRRGRLLEALRLLAGAAQQLAPGAYPELGSARVQLERQASAQALAFYHHAVAELRVCPEAALQALRELRVGLQVQSRPETIAGQGEPASGAEEGCQPAAHVRIATLAEVAVSASACVDAVVAVDVDVESYPLSVREDAAVALSEKLGRAGVALAPAARMRRRFYRALRSSRTRAVLARVAHDGAADDRYPAALWTELASVASLPRAAGLPGEERVSENLGPAGPARLDEARHPAGAALAPAALPYLVLKHRDAAGDLVPRRLSASQIEGYLSCPYQWFLSSRVRPQELDAGFGPLETGNFVHDVMQRFHEELAQGPVGRVTPDNLDAELGHLRRVFEAVRAEHARGKTRSSGALIPLTASEGLQLEEVWRQLRRSVSAEADLLPGFKPAYAEYAFDKLDVTYAGWPLGGRIDRIDVDAAGRAVVIDYKHRALADFRLADPTSRLDPGEPLDPAWLPAHVQTLIYAQAVRRAFAGELEVVGALYFGTRTGAFAGAVAEAYAADGMVPGLKRGFPGKDGSLSFTDLLDHVEAAIAVRLAGLARGDIAPAAEPQDCRFCPAVSCERRKA